jgi:hypothetical protein
MGCSVVGCGIIKGCMGVAGSASEVVEVDSRGALY